MARNVHHTSSPACSYSQRSHARRPLFDNALLQTIRAAAAGLGGSVLARVGCLRFGSAIRKSSGVFETFELQTAHSRESLQHWPSSARHGDTDTHPPEPGTTSLSRVLRPGPCSMSRVLAPCRLFSTLSSEPYTARLRKGPRPCWRRRRRRCRRRGAGLILLIISLMTNNE
jgi:hypothetical protein